MKLSFKNKMLMAIEAMLEEGDKKHGIPKSISMKVGEGVELLQEIKYLQTDHSTVALSILMEPSSPPKDLSDPNHPVFLINMVKDTKQNKLSEQTSRAIIKAWQGGEIVVKYNYRGSAKVPLLLEQPARMSDKHWGI